MTGHTGVIYLEDAPMAGVGHLSRLLDYIDSGDPDLTNRQLAILMLCAWTRGPHKSKDLARLIRGPGAAVTRALNALEDYGFARRSRSGLSDNRQCYTEITDAGRTFLQRYIER
jgi:DNA-binding MarR family transcriptional regulator